MTHDRLLKLKLAYEQLARALDGLLQEAPAGIPVDNLREDRQRAWLSAQACGQLLERMPPPCLN